MASTSVPLPSDLMYGKVTWTALSAVADTRNDDDALPEGIPVTGFVTFTPSEVELLVFGEKPSTVMATTVTYAMGADGILRDAQGNEGVYLLATNAPGVTPTGWKWTVSYKLNNGLSRGSFSFDLPAGSSVDLTEVKPVTKANGVPIIRGPKGDPGLPGAQWPVVSHGTDANVARPDTTLPVIWFGTVDPINSDDTLDIWIPVGGDGAQSETSSTGKSSYAARWAPSAVPGEAGLPRLMEDLPIITNVGNDGDASPVAGGVWIPAVPDWDTGVLNTAFSFRGASGWRQMGTVANWPNQMFAVAKSQVGYEGGSNFPYVEFLHYGSWIAPRYKAGGGELVTRLWVDGKLTEMVPWTDPVQDGAMHCRLYQFDKPAWRRIRVDTRVPFAGVWAASDAVVTSMQTVGDRLMVVSDSFGEGVGAPAMSGYAPMIAGMLGFEELICLAQGATGAIATSGARVRYIDRLPNWQETAPSHVLVHVSVNDTVFPDAAVAGAYGEVLDAALALPSVKEVWMMGEPGVKGTPFEHARSRDALLRPIAESRGVPFVSLVSPTSIWTPSTVDTLVTSDTTHPTLAGHEGIARTFVNRLLLELNS